MDWVLWWEIDPLELDEQVTAYNTIPFERSMRGISVIFLLVNVVLLGYGAGRHPEQFIEGGLTATFALFTYLGHRWSIIGAMVLWTVEKIAAIVAVPDLGILQLLWWAAMMHALYFALRVERRRSELK